MSDSQRNNREWAVAIGAVIATTIISIPAMAVGVFTLGIPFTAALTMTGITAGILALLTVINDRRSR